MYYVCKCIILLAVITTIAMLSFPVICDLKFDVFTPKESTKMQLKSFQG